jgi:hypothetical protein
MSQLTFEGAGSVPVSYKLRKVRRIVGRGASQPSHCDIGAILKFDSAESQFATYNELVAVRLGQATGFPIADGILTVGPTGHAFASLEIGAPALPLPDLTESFLARAVAKYRREAAQLVVFDAWIGNHDRFANMKAALIAPHIHLFAGFDHGHALLGCAATAELSLDALLSKDSFVARHPFVPFLQLADIDPVLTELIRLSARRIEQACIITTTISNVSLDNQRALAGTLVRRRRNLRRILSSVPFRGA